MSDQESRARNAARDAANSFNRFERDFDRMLRTLDGLPRSIQRKAIAQGCDSSDRRRAITLILARTKEAQAKAGGES